MDYGISKTIKGVYEGMQLAVSLNITHLHVFSDCKVAIDMLICEKNDLGIYTPIV